MLMAGKWPTLVLYRRGGAMRVETSGIQWLSHSSRKTRTTAPYLMRRKDIPPPLSLVFSEEDMFFCTLRESATLLVNHQASRLLWCRLQYHLEHGSLYAPPPTIILTMPAAVLLALLVHLGSAVFASKSVTIEAWPVLSNSEPAVAVRWPLSQT